jgi:hypothetical protein
MAGATIMGTLGTAVTDEGFTLLGLLLLLLLVGIDCGSSGDDGASGIGPRGISVGLDGVPGANGCAVTALDGELLELIGVLVTFL